ncbi:MAG: glycosyltransferase family 1 protein, partial [Lachnospiraceae bacterium]|nr:glycosyltransferase family 1 protein [Lachnospiraceae bacterium]
TEPNPWLAEKYQDGMHLIYLDHTNPNQAVADIQYLLAHPDRCAEIANAGKERAKEQDTWEHRLSSILEMMDEDMTS